MTGHDEKHPIHDEDVGSKVEDVGSDLEASDGKIQWTVKGVIATASLCGVWTGAQIPLFFVGGSLSYIVQDLGSPSVSSWLPVSYTLAIGATAPFCGYLADLTGQRNVVLIGELLVILGIILLATAQGFNQACAGMGIIGGGAAITELTALAGISSIVPVNRRGWYLALCTSFLLPFTPYLLYSQLISTRSTWRWTIWLCLIYNVIWGLGLLLTFFPVKTASSSTQRKAVLSKIDYVGGALSIAGITLFLVALGAGGYTHPWESAYVLATLIVGIVLIAAFVMYEIMFAPHPMIPRALFADQGGHVVAKAFLVAFVAGMNLYSLLNFFPLTLSTVFEPDPITVGVRGLGYGISVTAGATIVNALLSVFPKYNRELLVASTVIMTAFGGALSAVTPDTPILNVVLATIGGFGVGGVYIPSATIALTVCADALISTVGALSLSVRTIGGAIGYTIYFNVFVTRLTAALPTAVATAAATAGLAPEQLTAFVTAFATAPATAASIPGVTPGILAAATRASQDAHAYALRYVWFVSIPFGVVSILASLFIGSTAKYMSGRIAARIR